MVLVSTPRRCNSALAAATDSGSQCSGSLNISSSWSFGFSATRIARFLGASIKIVSYDGLSVFDPSPWRDTQACVKEVRGQRLAAISMHAFPTCRPLFEAPSHLH
jgi:hypothetical protein